MPQYKKVFDVGTYAGVSGFTRVGIPTLRTPGAGGKQVAKSLRFRSANTAYLSRTPGTTGDRQKFTYSAWIKRGTLATSVSLFSAYNNSGTTDSDWFNVTFLSGASPVDSININGWNTNYIRTLAIFSDPSAWYHIVVAVDTTSATSTITGTSTDRIRLYVNGIQIKTFNIANAPTQNLNTPINSTSYQHRIGSLNWSSAAQYFDGYMSEVYLIDGTALDPTSFGEYNSDNIWVPKAYSGSFAGTNSFYLDFSDVGTTTAGGANTGYGKDLSGKGTPNNWTTNNFGTTSTLATYDSMYDSPTDYDNSVYGAGNYATLNPLINGTLSTISEANLKASNTTGYDVVGTLWATTKCYYEYIITNTAAATTPVLGMGDPAIYLPATNNFQNVNGAFGVRKDGAVYVNGVAGSTYTSFTTGDIVGFAFDPATGKFWYHVNGVWVNSGNPTAGTGQAGTATVGYKYVPVINLGLSSAIVTLNCGQQPFRGVYVSGSGSSYTGTGAPPSGFSALNTKNITRPTDPNMWFYGDTPDLMWIKNRSATADHSLTDTVRGVGLGLTLTATATENGAQDVAEMNKFGMTLIGASSRTTAASNSFVYWGWKAGGATTATNTQGSITSQVSANVAAGFSIVSYTGNGSSGATIGHGLGATPGMVLVKNRNSAFYFATYHSSLSAGNQVFLDLDAAQASITTVYSYGGVSSVSSTTFTVIPGITNISNVNASGNAHVAYCFAPIAGYSSFGSYTANASTDGPMVFTNFRPRFVLLKNTTRVLNWIIYDTSRDLYNTETQQLYPNTTGNEISGANIDFLSNGFKIRGGSASGINHTSGDTYIYAAFAEVPFKIARAR